MIFMDPSWKADRKATIFFTARSAATWENLWWAAKCSMDQQWRDNYWCLIGGRKDALWQHPGSHRTTEFLHLSFSVQQKILSCSHLKKRPTNQQISSNTDIVWHTHILWTSFMECFGIFSENFQAICWMFLDSFGAFENLAPGRHIQTDLRQWPWVSLRRVVNSGKRE